MTMKKHIFASSRGADFEVEGLTALDAWERLCELEKDNGSLWKTSGEYRNNIAVSKQGFSKLQLLGGFVAYKEVEYE